MEVASFEHAAIGAVGAFTYCLIRHIEQDKPG
jgi:hypothetical protein